MKSITPYIYKLTFKPDGRVYIGSRFNKSGCHPDEFWTDGGYFTSSRHIKQLIASHGVSRDVWLVEILEVFDSSIDLKSVPVRENEIILRHVKELGKHLVINRRWVEDGKGVYTNAGMSHNDNTKSLISHASKGLVVAKDSAGNVVKVTKEEFDSRSDLVGIGAGKKFYHNPTTMERIKLHAHESPPVGFLPGLGKTFNEDAKVKLAKKITGHTIINNGVVNKRHDSTQPIPEGWVHGKIIKHTLPNWTEERREKFLATRKANNKRRKMTPEQVEANRQMMLDVNNKRRAENKPHWNSGRTRTEESIRKQQESRRRNKQIQELS